ncbi:hypothetical protein MRB53_015862 [Persea americana]|uniref:Uncharacterized protein n=1 Tax=Persea americana TaxID=3435 RepID=A0ACC2M154_PERAE|nr:hypothetical protein MRB53_015862 [Persea americana]
MKILKAKSILSPMIIEKDASSKHHIDGDAVAVATACCRKRRDDSVSLLRCSKKQRIRTLVTGNRGIGFHICWISVVEAGFVSDRKKNTGGSCRTSPLAAPWLKRKRQCRWSHTLPRCRSYSIGEGENNRASSPLLQNPIEEE